MMDEHVAETLTDVRGSDRFLDPARDFVSSSTFGGYDERAGVVHEISPIRSIAALFGGRASTMLDD